LVSIDAVGLGLPAVGGDQISIVLHRGGPVVHEVLVDGVLVDQRLAGVVGQQVLGQRDDQVLGVEAGLQTLSRPFGAGAGWLLPAIKRSAGAWPP
jgi:hypothetical protein